MFELLQLLEQLARGRHVIAGQGREKVEGGTQASVIDALEVRAGTTGDDDPLVAQLDEQLPGAPVLGPDLIVRLGLVRLLELCTRFLELLGGGVEGLEGVQGVVGVSPRRAPGGPLARRVGQFFAAAVQAAWPGAVDR